MSSLTYMKAVIIVIIIIIIIIITVEYTKVLEFLYCTSICIGDDNTDIGVKANKGILQIKEWR